MSKRKTTTRPKRKKLSTWKPYQNRRPASKARLEQVRLAPRTHGLGSEFARNGDESTLLDGQRSRLVELRATLQTPEGVRDALIERAARMVLLCEWGESYLAELAEQEGGARAFEAKMLQRFVSVAESARRSLQAIAQLQAKGDGSLSAGDVLEAIQRDQSK